MTWRPTVLSWQNIYVPGTSYHAGSVVRDNYWTMVANTDTDDRPAPQPTGDILWLSDLNDTPAWVYSQNSTTQLVVGQRYTVVSSGWMSRLRFWFPPQTNSILIAVWIVKDPTGSPNLIELIGEIVPDKEDMWVELPVGSNLVTAGEVFDVVVPIKMNGTTSSFSYDWAYKKKNGDPAATAGEVWHQSGGGEMRFSNEDSGGTNRRTNLTAVTVGGTITASGQTWIVYDIDTTDLDHVSYFVTPATRISESTYTFAFAYDTAANIDYVSISNHYSTEPHPSLFTVKGYFSNDGYDPDDATKLNENAYGVDIEFQEAAISADWDLLAYSGGEGGGGIVAIEKYDFALEVSKGNIPGHSGVNKYGRSTDVDTGVLTDIWDRANATDTQPIWVAPTTARIHNIVSSSASDAYPSGVGARTIRVYGLTSWTTKEVSEDIQMNGVTNVPTSNSYVIIHRMRVLTKGATGVNVGQITATAVTDGTVTAQIQAGAGQTQMAIWGFPSIQNAHVTGIYAGILRANLGTTEAQADIQWVLNPEPDVELLNFIVKHPTMIGSRAASPFQHRFNPYLKFEGPGILKVQADGSANNLDIGAGFSVILVDN